MTHPSPKLPAALLRTAFFFPQPVQTNGFIFAEKTKRLWADYHSQNLPHGNQHVFAVCISNRNGNRSTLTGATATISTGTPAKDLLAVINSRKNFPKLKVMEKIRNKTAGLWKTGWDLFVQCRHRAPIRRFFTTNQSLRQGLSFPRICREAT